MRQVLGTQIDGLFEGYEQGRLYRLTNGQTWRQVCLTSQYIYRDDPPVQLLHDGVCYYLKVEGTDGVIQVELARSLRGDEFCDVHVNTLEGFRSLLRSWLRPHPVISQESLPFYLGFFEFTHHVRSREKSLLRSLIGL